MEEVYSFGYWVMRRRKALDLTRAGLAQQVSCSPETIKKIERDERRPSRQVAELLAEALAVPGEERELFLQAARGERPADQLSLTGQPLHLKAHRGKPSHNLPRHLTHFIGREREIVAVRQLVIRSRLVTLTGVGGSGKTRLAMKVVEDLLDAFPDGIWLVELAALSDPALAASFITATFGLIEEKDRSPLDALVGFLRDRQFLLLLDNCEHLIETMARLVETLAHRCPTLHILTTSREPLQIDGEAVWLVPPLSLPPAEEQLPMEFLAGHDSIRLFVERASATWPAFRLGGQNAAVVAQLCRRLDGIPMAIELAAARVRLLSVEEIVTRLDDRFRLLIGGKRTAPPRHQTLRALIDWSYDLLPPVEQRLLCRLAVFAGGFSLEEVKGISHEENEGHALDLLSQLVNKSLVVGDRVSGKKTRYYLHETIRQYGLERLAEEGAVEHMRDRHAAFYCRLAEEAEPQLYQAGQIAWLDQLEEKYDNLRAALNWTLIEHSESVETGLRLAVALAYYWEMRGVLLEGHRWLTAALEKVKAASVPLQAAVYLNAGNFWLEHPLWGEGLAIQCARESLNLYSRLEEDKGIAWSLRLLGNCSVYFEQNHDRATLLLEQALTLAEALNDKVLLVRAYQNLGRALMFKGELANAARAGEKGLALARETGDHWAIGFLSYHLGYTAIRQGDYARAEAHLLDALDVCRELRLEVNATKTLILLGDLARLQEEYPQAANYYQEYLTIASRVAGWDRYSSPLSKLGHVAIRQGDPALALGFFRQSIDSDPSGGNVLWNLWGLGLVTAAQGRTRSAVRLYAAVEKLLESGNEQIVFREDQEDFRRNVALVRGELEEHDFAAAWAEGLAMSPDEAIARALKAQV